jgi:hypothetical protein
MNAGVRIQGVIIADDKRKTNPPPITAKPVVSRPSTRPVLSMIGKVVRGWVAIPGAALGRLAAIAGVARHGLADITGVALRALVVIARVALRVLVGVALVGFLGLIMGPFTLLLAPMIILGAAMGGPSTKFDPKLIVLVEDGNGGTAWISVLTWFD